VATLTYPVSLALAGLTILKPSLRAFIFGEKWYDIHRSADRRSTYRKVKTMDANSGTDSEFLVAVRDAHELQARYLPPREMTETKIAHVWAVDPARGDLYVVRLPDMDSLVVVDEGIVNHSEHVRNTEMSVGLDADGNVIAMPVENGRGWVRCRRPSFAS
jgi:hypothetical protein